MTCMLSAHSQKTIGR